MKFAEQLPNKCPPTEATDSGFPILYRLLPTQNPTEDHFKSHAALGKAVPPNVDECRWASCSLVLDAKKQKKLPRFKHTHHFAAELKLPSGSGKAKKSGKNHYDFWRAANFSFLSAIVNVIRL